MKFSKWKKTGWQMYFSSLDKIYGEWCSVFLVQRSQTILFVTTQTKRVSPQCNFAHFQFSKLILHFYIWISISLFVVHVRVSFYLYGLYPLKLDHYDFNNRMQYLQTIWVSGKAISLNDSCIFDSAYSHFLPPNQK